MAEESVEFPEDEALDELYRPLKLAPQDRKVVLGEEEYQVIEEVQTDLFEIEADRLTKMSPMRAITENIVPLLLTELDQHVLREQLRNHAVRPVEVMKAFSPVVEKLGEILEKRTVSIRKKRQALPK